MLFQLARRSHNMAILCSWDYPLTHPARRISGFLSMLCCVPTQFFPPATIYVWCPPSSICFCPNPNVSPIKKVCAKPPPPSILCPPSSTNEVLLSPSVTLLAKLVFHNCASGISKLCLGHFNFCCVFVLFLFCSVLF